MSDTAQNEEIESHPRFALWYETWSDLHKVQVICTALFWKCDIQDKESCWMAGPHTGPR